MTLNIDNTKPATIVAAVPTSGYDEEEACPAKQQQQPEPPVNAARHLWLVMLLVSLTILALLIYALLAEGMQNGGRQYIAQDDAMEGEP